MEIPLYRLFCYQQESALPPNLPRREISGDSAWGNSKEGQKMLTVFRRVLSRSGPEIRNFYL